MPGKMTLLTLMTLALVAWVAGGCSDSSSTPTAVDTVPPAVPTGLGYEYAEGVGFLSWSPNNSKNIFHK